MSFDLTYNGFTVSTTDGVSPLSISGLDGVDIRTASSDLINGDGGNIFNQLYSKRTVSVQFFVSGATVNAFKTARDALLEAFQKTNTDNTLEITFWDDPATTYSLDARVISMPEFQFVGGNVKAYRVQVQMLCQNIYFKDNTQNSITLSLDEIDGFDDETGTGGDGFDVSTGSNTFDVTTTGSNSTQTITLTGSGVENPEFIIRGSSNPLTNPTVINQTTGVSFQINTSINIGDFVRIKKTNAQLTVELNDSTNYFSFFIGDYINLQPGNNILSFSAQTYDAVSEVEVLYFNRYLYL